MTIWFILGLRFYVSQQGSGPFCGDYLDYSVLLFSALVLCFLFRLFRALFYVSQHGSCTFCVDYLEQCFTYLGVDLALSVAKKSAVFYVSQQGACAFCGDYLDCSVLCISAWDLRFLLSFCWSCVFSL